MDIAPDAVRDLLGVPGCAILDDNQSRPDGITYLFSSPTAFCVAWAPDEVEPAFARIEEHLREGRHAVGYFSYELGYCFSPRTRKLCPATSEVPLLCVGIYERRLAVPDALFQSALEAQTRGSTVEILNCHLNMTRAEYLDRLGRVKAHIYAGDTYEVNYTLKYKFRCQGSPLRLYCDLRSRQRVRYGAYLDFPGLTVLSRSPELFIEKVCERIQTRPMKGTAQRGATANQDRENARRLAADAKNCAENVMIVDLLRNDLSRISHRGTVRTSNLFHVETYETLHQMVSTVSATVPADIALSRVMSHLFPCGSITGAPKVRTMEIINDLEVEHRGVYTGAIGHITPQGDICLNVAIRTLALWPGGRGEMGVGSGVVYDSDPLAEYEECRLKGQFLTDRVPDFQLIECLLFDGNEYAARDAHVARLAKSAADLGFRMDRSAIESSLSNAARTLTRRTKVRLVVDRDGRHRIDCVPVTSQGPATRSVTIAAERVDSRQWTLRHKTSLRSQYDEAYAHYSALGFYDVLFTNERGEITEGTFNNVFVRRGDRWCTPPVGSGVLPGIRRQRLLDSPELDVVERVLWPSDLAAADEIVLTNAIRDVVRVELHPNARATAREATTCSA